MKETHRDILSTCKLLVGGGRLVVAGGFDFSDEVALASCEALMGSSCCSARSGYIHYTIPNLVAIYRLELHLMTHHPN